MLDEIVSLKSLMSTQCESVTFRSGAPASSLVPHGPIFSFGTFPRELSRFYYRHTDLWELGVFDVRDVKVSGAYFMVKEGRLVVCPEANIHEEHVRESYEKCHAEAGVSTEILVSGHVALIAGPGYSVYGHWLADFLPKMYLLHVCGYDIKKISYLMPLDIPAFGLEWLKLIGIPSDRLIRYDAERGVVVAEHLLVPTTFHNGVRASSLLKKAADFLSDLVDRESPPDSMPSTRRRIFLSRKFASQARALQNRARIEELALGAGLIETHPQALSLLEQIRLFRSASMIFGEYGSALHGSLFSPPGTIICSLRGSAQHPGFIQSGFGFSLQQPTGYVFGRDINEHGEFFVEEEDFLDCMKVLLRSGVIEGF